MAITRATKSSISTFKKFNNAKGDLATGAGIFWATSSTGEILTSSDGLSWTIRTTLSAATNGVCVYDNGKYWAGGAYSTDGITWTAGQTPYKYRNISGSAQKTDDGYYADNFGNSYCFGKDRLFYASSTTTTPGVYGNAFIVRDFGAPYMRSTTDGGLTWTDNNQARITAAPSYVISTPGFFYANDSNTGNLCYSTTGSVWTPVLSGVWNAGGRPLRYANGAWAALYGGTTTLYTSTDGTTFTSRTLPSATGSSTWDFTYGAGLWLMVASGGKIFTSSNLTTWSAQTSGSTNQLYSVNYY